MEEILAEKRNSSRMVSIELFCRPFAKNAKVFVTNVLPIRREWESIRVSESNAFWPSSAGYVRARGTGSWGDGAALIKVIQTENSGVLFWPGERRISPAQRLEKN